MAGLINSKSEICPFSKPILGKWCACCYAKLADRCSGKMVCTRLSDLYESCNELDVKFKKNTRFILGVTSTEYELTHAHLMKIRCGGLLGMQRVLGINNTQPVNVRDIIDKTLEKFSGIDSFPFNEIVLDIKNFRHRK